jgi:hypothetical protein
MDENPYKAPQEKPPVRLSIRPRDRHWAAVVMVVSGVLFVISLTAGAVTYVRENATAWFAAFEVALVAGIYVWPILCLIALIIWLRAR